MEAYETSCFHVDSGLWLCSSTQVHSDNAGSDKPLMECDPIQLAIFSHRSALLCFHLFHANSLALPD